MRGKAQEWAREEDASHPCKRLKKNGHGVVRSQKYMVFQKLREFEKHGEQTPMEHQHLKEEKKVMRRCPEREYGGQE